VQAVKAIVMMIVLALVMCYVGVVIMATWK